MMKWNDSGKNDQNPWSNRSDDPFAEFQKLLKKLFDGGNNGNDDQGNSGKPNKRYSARLIAIVLSILTIVWLATGYYEVKPAEQGVVTRFGKFLKTTQAGPNWHLPYPIEEVAIVNVSIVRNIEIGFRSGRGKVLSESLMLTQDENIVDVQLSVQYQVSNAKDFLFNVLNPEATLMQVVESALRETVGKSRMDLVITEGREQVAIAVKELAQASLDQFNIGLLITNLNMQNAQAPEQVQAAFNDAVKAREDRERFINEAQAYANKILPQARGEAARIVAEARAYKERVVAQAEGETERFDNIYREYSKAPEVTRERLYIDAIEQVLNNSNKVIVDIKGGNNLLYLPLDRLVPNITRSNGNSQMLNINDNSQQSDTFNNNLRNRDLTGGRTR